MTDEWIEHDGSGMPVAGGRIVDVRFRDGEIETEEAGLYTLHQDWWSWEGDPENNILAYRLAKP